MNSQIKDNSKKFILVTFSILFLFCTNQSVVGEEKIIENVSRFEETQIHFLSNDCRNKKKVLILIHGSPGAASDFQIYLKDKDLQRQFCILVPDRLGYGNSMKENSVPNIFQQGRNLQTAISNYLKKESLVFESGIVVGHSYGGPIALVYLMESDSKVWKAVLLSAPVDPDLEELVWYNHLANLSFVSWILPKSWVHSNQEMFALKSDLIQLTKMLENKSLNILSIHGEKDFLVSVNNVNYLTNHYKHIKNKTLILKGENHFIPWTNFAEIKNIILMEVSL